MIEVVIALCYVLGAWFYSILRYYDLWKRGKVPVVFFAFLHVFSLIVVFLFETGISAMISDVVSVIMHAYSVIYGSVMILTPILCFVRGIVRFIGKKAGYSGKVYRFFNHPTKLILGFFVVTMCVGAVIFWKSRCISWEETVISQENKKEPVKDTSIVYISNCFVGSDMTAHAFDSLVEKVNEKKPDVILFGGNLFGRHTKEVTVDKTLASIKKMKAALGIYMVEGKQTGEVSLVTPDGKPYVTMDFDAPLFAIWSPEGKDAPFVCIEPWYGRCDADDFDGTLEERAYEKAVEPEQIFEASYSIRYL